MYDISFMNHKVFNKFLNNTLLFSHNQGTANETDKELFFSFAFSCDNCINKNHFIVWCCNDMVLQFPKCSHQQYLFSKFFFFEYNFNFFFFLISVLSASWMAVINTQAAAHIFCGGADRHRCRQTLLCVHDIQRSSCHDAHKTWWWGGRARWIHPRSPFTHVCSKDNPPGFQK